MKASKSLIPLLITIVLIYLLVPDFLVQAFCVTLFFLILISFFYALIIKKNLSVERYSGELKLLEHEAARWLTHETLHSVNWLPADELILDEIEKLL